MKMASHQRSEPLSTLFMGSTMFLCWGNSKSTTQCTMSVRDMIHYAWVMVEWWCCTPARMNWMVTLSGIHRFWQHLCSMSAMTDMSIPWILFGFGVGGGPQVPLEHFKGPPPKDWFCCRVSRSLWFHWSCSCDSSMSHNPSVCWGLYWLSTLAWSLTHTSKRRCWWLCSLLCQHVSNNMLEPHTLPNQCPDLQIRTYTCSLRNLGSDMI